MSCTLTSISQICDVDKLQALLKDSASDQQDIVDKAFGDDFDVDNANTWGDGWEENDDWAANDEFPVQPKPQPDKSAKSWLQTCRLSLSPAEDLIVFSKEDKGVFLLKKWPKGTPSTTSSVESEQPGYEITWSGSLAVRENETITCIVAVPLASRQSPSRSSQGSPDWTCVIAGFSTGFIRIYTNTGTLLLSQFLHDGPVLNISVRTRSLFTIMNEQVDEMLILYYNSIVTIDGFSLYQSLRACRNQLAKAQASVHSGEVIEPPPLAYKKWRSGNQKKVKDCISCGVKSPCFFDRLQTASVIGGLQAKVKGSSPAFNRFLTTGTEPFLCYYQALEGSNQPILSDVALAYASKLTSAVFSSVKQFTMASSWFGGGKNQNQTPEKDAKGKVERGTALPARFGLFDQHRITESIKISPIGNLAIFTDTFNRVSLVCTETGVIQRTWKGYRDAECGWVVVEEEDEEDNISKDDSSEKSLKRRALFCVIYAPKRGILEIYLTEHGTRVGAFNVGKNCKLICPTYQCLGQTRVLPNFSCNQLNQCFLLQEDGSIRTIRVPFHCSLSNVHSIRAKDAHQLRRVATWIAKGKSKPESDEVVISMVSIILDIQASTMQKKAVELLIDTTGLKPKFIENCLTKICDGLQKSLISKGSAQEDIEYHAEKSDLLVYCHAKKHLIKLYLTLKSIQEQEHNVDRLGEEDCIEMTSGEPKDRQQSVAELLHITGTETRQFLGMVDRYQTTCLDSPTNCGHQRKQHKNSKMHAGKESKVDAKSSCRDDIDVNSFLTCFVVDSNNHTHQQQHQKRLSKDQPSTSLSSNNFKISLNEKLMNNDMRLRLGCLFFESSIRGEGATSRLAFILETSRIPPNQIMVLLAEYSQSVVNSDVLFKDHTLVLLFSLVSSVCALKDGAEKTSVDLPVGEASGWWQSVRNILAKSVLVGQALIMAVVCRSVAMEIQSAAQKVKAQDESDIVSGGWEAVTVDMELWNLLVCQLQNLINLDCFIHSNHAKVAALSGVESPIFRQKHSHSISSLAKDDQASSGKSTTSSYSSSSKLKHDNTEISILPKGSDRIPSLSVQGILENNRDAIPQIVADCLVRQGVPGPCLGTRRPKQRLAFRGRLASQNQSQGDGDVTMMDIDADDDLPEEQVVDKEDPAHSSDTLAALVELRGDFPYSLEQDRLWAHCVWESIMVWNEDTEDISMLRSALIHLSCIHNIRVQQGLATMMWKAVFNETIKSTLSLIEKIGKAPKDRLCRKTVSLGYKALEEFLDVSRKLLELLMDLGMTEECEEVQLKTEDIWSQEESENSQQQSIEKQAFDEAQCNMGLLNHFWCLVTSLYLIMFGWVRNIKPLSLFDTKGKHAFTFPLHSSPVLSSEVDDKITKCRREFCRNTICCVVKQHLDLTFQNERSRSNTSNLLHTLATVFSLSNAFALDHDDVIQFAACELYRAGLDLAAQEVAMAIEDKAIFSSRMMDVIGGRIAKCLLSGENGKFSDALSKLPTNISSWLSKLERSAENVAEIPIIKTYLLLQYLNSNHQASKESKMMNELIECLKAFV